MIQFIIGVFLIIVLLIPALLILLCISLLIWVLIWIWNLIGRACSWSTDDEKD